MESDRFFPASTSARIARRYFLSLGLPVCSSIMVRERTIDTPALIRAANCRENTALSRMSMDPSIEKSKEVSSEKKGFSS